MANKPTLQELKDRATGMGIDLKGTETVEQVKKLTAEFIANINNPANLMPPGEPNPNANPSEPAAPFVPEHSVTPPAKSAAPAEQMVPVSDIKKMIAEEIARDRASRSDDAKPKKAKKITEHFAHLWRLDGKWIVDFTDRNIDKETGEKVDPYIRSKVHAFQKYNPEKREFEAWIELVFHDGSKKEMSLPKYVEHRFLVYCQIQKRERIDASYDIGEVELKKDNGDMYVGTGVMIDQSVNMFEERFTIQTPDGAVLTVPDYVIA